MKGVVEMKNKGRYVKLLVNSSKESDRARELLYKFEDPRIEVEGFPTHEHGPPVAFWNGSPYYGAEEIEELVELLRVNLKEGRI